MCKSYEFLDTVSPDKRKILNEAYNRIINEVRPYQYIFIYDNKLSVNYKDRTYSNVYFIYDTAYRAYDSESILICLCNTNRKACGLDLYESIIEAATTFYPEPHPLLVLYISFNSCNDIAHTGMKLGDLYTTYLRFLAIIDEFTDGYRELDSIDRPGLLSLLGIPEYILRIFLKSVRYNLMQAHIIARVPEERISRIYTSFAGSILDELYVIVRERYLLRLSTPEIRIRESHIDYIVYLIRSNRNDRKYELEMIRTRNRLCTTYGFTPAKIDILIMHLKTVKWKISYDFDYNLLTCRDKLLPYQTASIARATGVRAFAFFLEPGMGKTLVALSDMEVHSSIVDTYILITYRRLMENWKNEIEKHCMHSIRDRLVMIGVEAFSNYTVDRIVALADEYANKRIFLCIDESTIIKNMLSNRYINIKTLIFHLISRHSTLIIRLLSGTPFSNRKEQILPQLNLMKYDTLLVDRTVLESYERIRDSTIATSINRTTNRELGELIDILDSHCIFFNKEDFGLCKEFDYSIESIRVDAEDAEILRAISAMLDQLYLLNLRNRYIDLRSRAIAFRENAIRMESHGLFIDKHSLSGGCYTENIRSKIAEYLAHYDEMRTFLSTYRSFYFLRPGTRREVYIESTNIRISTSKYDSLSLVYTREYVQYLLNTIESNPAYAEKEIRNLMLRIFRRDRKIIIGSYYIRNLELLKRIAAEITSSVYTITSDKDFATRATTVAEFEASEVGIMVVSVRCFSHGLSILHCSTIILLEICYELETLKQITARIDRVDSENKIKRIVNVINDSIDSIAELYEAQLDKKESIDTLLRTIKCRTQSNIDINDIV